MWPLNRHCCPLLGFIHSQWLNSQKLCVGATRGSCCKRIPFEKNLWKTTYQSYARWRLQIISLEIECFPRPVVSHWLHSTALWSTAGFTHTGVSVLFYSDLFFFLLFSPSVHTFLFLVHLIITVHSLNNSLGGQCKLRSNFYFVSIEGKWNEEGGMEL